MNRLDRYSTDPEQFDRRPRHSVSFKNNTIMDKDGRVKPFPDMVMHSDNPIHGGDLMEFLWEFLASGGSGEAPLTGGGDEDQGRDAF